MSEAITCFEDEAELVARARNGDAAAFDAIVALHRPRLVGLCTRWLSGDRHLAEDVAQEALVRAYRQILFDERPLRLRAWLDTTARNACMDEHRRRRPQPIAEVPDVPDGRTAEPTLPDDSLREAWNRLEDRQRTALRLRELDGRSYREIAAVLGLTLAATQGLIWRSRSALRREYARVGGGLALPPAVVRAESLLRNDLAGRLASHSPAVGSSAQAAGSIGLDAMQHLGHRLLSVLAPIIPGSMDSALAGLAALVLSVAPLAAPLFDAADLPLEAPAVEAPASLPPASLPEEPPPAPGVPTVSDPDPATGVDVQEPSAPPAPDDRPVRALIERVIPRPADQHDDPVVRVPETVRQTLESVLSGAQSLLP